MPTSQIDPRRNWPHFDFVTALFDTMASPFDTGEHPEQMVEQLRRYSGSRSVCMIANPEVPSRLPEFFQSGGPPCAETPFCDNRRSLLLATLATLNGPAFFTPHSDGAPSSRCAPPSLLVPVQLGNVRYGILAFSGLSGPALGPEVMGLLGLFGNLLALWIGAPALHSETIDPIVKSLAEMAPIGIFHLDETGECRFANSHWKRILDVPDPAHAPRTWLKRIHMEDRLPLLDAWRNRSESPNFDRTFRLSLPDGRIRWVHAMIAPASSGHIGILTDITRRKRNEEILRFQATLLDSVRESVIATDMDGVVRYWGKGAEALYGFTSEETLGKPLPITIDRSRMGLTRQLFEKVRKGQISSWKNWQVSKSNRPFYAETFLSLVTDDAGTPTGIIGIAHDITERYRVEKALDKVEKGREEMEKLLLQSQKMESIGTLAGGIAHDFNNILSPIIGYAELLTADARSDQTEYLDEILEAARRARDLIKQILTFGRASEGELRPTCPRTLVKDCVKMLRASIPTDVKIRVDTEECGELFCDATQLQQVITNLVTNAYQAIEDDTGEIRIMVRKKRFFPAPANLAIQAGEYVRISVHDNGIGMPPETRDRIFDPYFTTKKHRGGTGLGLSMVHSIVNHHQGAISLTSVPGRGTTFHLYFPVALEQTKQTRPTRPRCFTGGSEHILVVDDEKAIAWMLKEMLERIGYSVTVCTDSRKALGMVTDDPDIFDLVITDMTMPELTGDRLATRLIEIRSDLPVILMTGHSERINEHRARKLGIQTFLMKPFERDHVNHAIRTALGGEDD